MLRRARLFQKLLVAASSDTSRGVSAGPQFQPSGASATKPTALSSPGKPTGGQGRSPDAKRNKCVELYAMDWASRYYKGRGYEVEDTSATMPFDLLCKKGPAKLRVEVKGTAGSGESVLVTRNEVMSARDNLHRTDLIVVSEIEVVSDNQGYKAHGGDLDRIEGWDPSDSQLEPLSYRYTLPTRS